MNKGKKYATKQTLSILAEESATGNVSVRNLIKSKPA